MSNPSYMGIQFAGRGRLEGHPPGEVDGARFEGRFVIYALTGPDGSVFGREVSLFDAGAVDQFGRGPASAHLVSVRSGATLEGFVTGTDEEDFPGHTIGRSTSDTVLRIFYSAEPDGTRNFDDRTSFMSGELVATYEAEEFFQINNLTGVFDTRVNYTLKSSKPFTHGGVEVDLGKLAPRMIEKAHGVNPSPDPNPEAIPDEDPFRRRGTGMFASRFPVGGAITFTG